MKTPIIYKGYKICQVCDTQKSRRSFILNKNRAICTNCLNLALDIQSTISGKYKIEGNCHIWTKALRDNTHPIVRHNNKTHSVRKLIYNTKLNNSKIGTFIYNTCGNDNCINPNHLVKKADILPKT